MSGFLGGNDQTLNSLFAPLHLSERSVVIPAELSQKAVELLTATCGGNSPEEDSDEEEQPSVNITEFVLF